MQAELNRLRRRLVLILDLIREMETERAEMQAVTANDATVQKIMLATDPRHRGELSAVLVHEVLYRSFADRRQLASYGGRTRPSAARNAARSRSHERSDGRPRIPCAEQEGLDPALDPQLLLYEMFALTVGAFGILLVGRRHAHHTANVSVAAEPSCQRTQHAFGIEPVGFGPPRPPVHQNTGRLKHVGIDAIARQSGQYALSR